MSYFLCISAFYFYVVQFLSMVFLVFELVVDLIICSSDGNNFFDLKKSFFRDELVL
jgi:hypothetical protein